MIPLYNVISGMNPNHVYHIITYYIRLLDYIILHYINYIILFYLLFLYEDVKERSFQAAPSGSNAESAESSPPRDSSRRGPWSAERPERSKHGIRRIEMIKNSNPIL